MGWTSSPALQGKVRMEGAPYISMKQGSSEETFYKTLSNQSYCTLYTTRSSEVYQETEKIIKE